MVSSFLPGAFGAPVGVFCLPCGIPPVFMAIIWSVSLTPACPLRVTAVWGCSLDPYMACDWLALLSSSALFQDSVICADFWSRQYGPHTACVRLRLVSLVYGGFDPLLLRCAWWSSLLVGSSTSPSPGRLFEPSYLGRLLCLRLD